MKNGTWTPGHVLLDGYVIDRELGKGGMGIVYLVRRSPDNQLFALKTRRTDRCRKEEHRIRVFRELRTWIELPYHDNITACRFFRTIEKRVGIFSEYVDGGSLKNWIATGL